jgi:glycosyltransferase involved in cell wall biosynthesis
MNNPLVSVIIPTFNRSLYLEQAVMSVLRQTYKNLECIVVDDGSTDNTHEIINKLGSRDSRIKYFYKENGGVSSARNFGINKSKGEWIQFLDSDDWLNHDKISFQLKFYSEFESDSTDDVVLYSDYTVVHESEQGNVNKTITRTFEPISKKQLLQQVLGWYHIADCPLHVNNTLFTKNILDKNRFYECKEFIFEDLELWVRLLVQNISFVHTPIVGMYFRRHQSNITLNPHNYKGYTRYLEAIYDLDKNLLIYTPIDRFIRMMFTKGDRDDFFRLIKINPLPIWFAKGKIGIRNIWLLKIIFLLKSLLPKFIYISCSLIYKNFYKLIFMVNHKFSKH